MNEAQIRRAVLDDDRALALLDHRAWSSDSAVAGRPRADRAFFWTGHTPDQFLVAVLGRALASPPPGTGGGEIAGCIRVVSPTTLPSNAHVRRIQGLAVDPAVRCRGIGRALVDAACERASGEGATRITLRVLSSNAAARNLYAAAGFTVEGILPGEFHIGGRFVDDILMGRPLR
ncbi:MAG TPA: N-acetyltransferase [Streptosporangiaceae bacterium]|nr:N-acetyltransferase [Streptosporangiaceae bacterium]